MIVYSNSCSFGITRQHLVYGDHFANYLGTSLINRGRPGSCNRRIIRTSIRDLSSLYKTEKNITALIGLTFISRTELWQTGIDATDNDGHFHPIMIDHEKVNWSSKGLIDTIVPDVHQLANPEIRNYYKEWLIHYHPEPTITDLVTDLLMFAGWARDLKIKYLIFSNVDLFPGQHLVDTNSPFLESLSRDFLDDPSVIDPWSFSFGTWAREQGYRPKDADLYGIHGHPGEDAHRGFSKILIDKFNKIYTTE